MDFHILRQQGLSIRKIATLRGVSRNRVRRALRSPAPPTGSRQRAKGIKLDPFRPLIINWLRGEVTGQWTAERMFDELAARGYDGGRTILKEFLRVHRAPPSPIAEARFYVKAGQQMQVDWGEIGVVLVGGVARKLYVFVAVMAWSRALFVRFTTNMQLLTWLDCHRQAFTFFGGVPSEVLIDNLKTGVISRAGGTVRYHPQYEQLAVGYGFRPIACFPQRPKTKGRVERMVRFVRERFFAGREIGDLEELNGQAFLWLQERANTRTHRTTGQRPCDRFAIEHAALLPLREYDVVLEEPRVADAYALVSVDGVRYSVPPEYARQPVVLHRRPAELSFLVDGQIVARHGYAAAGERVVQDPAHLPPRPKPCHERFEQLGEAVVARMGEIGRAYVLAVERKAPHAPLAILREVLDRETEFGTAVVTSALRTLLQFSIVKRGRLSMLCYRFSSPRITLPTINALPNVDVEQRDLSVYDGAVA